MGFLGKLFGTEKELPPLDPSSPAAKLVEKQKSVLEAFVGKLKDPVELVPSEVAIYAFIGRPPDRFGIAWFEKDGSEHNLKSLVQAKKLSVLQQNTLSTHLRQAYERHAEEPRYALTLGGRSVKVTPSAGLEKDLVRVIHEVE